MAADEQAAANKKEAIAESEELGSTERASNIGGNILLEDAQDEQQAPRQLEACQVIHNFLQQQNETAIINGQKDSVWSQMI